MEIYSSRNLLGMQTERNQQMFNPHHFIQETAESIDFSTNPIPTLDLQCLFLKNKECEYKINSRDTNIEYDKINESPSKMDKSCIKLQKERLEKTNISNIQNITSSNSSKCSNSLLEQNSNKAPFILIKQSLKGEMISNDSIHKANNSKLPKLSSKCYGSSTLKVRQELQLWERLTREIKNQKGNEENKHRSQREAAIKMKKSFHTLKCNKSILKQAQKYIVNLDYYSNESFGKIREIVKKLKKNKGKVPII